MRAVIDTNVLVSARAGGSGRRLAGLLGKLAEGAYVPLYSAELLGELREVLDRPRIRRGLKIQEEDVAALFELLDRRGLSVAPTRRIAICRDPDDDRILEAAVAGQADVIVTGDDDLLALGSFEGIAIVRPATFLGMLEQGRGSGG